MESARASHQAHSRIGDDEQGTAGREEFSSAHSESESSGGDDDEYFQVVSEAERDFTK